MAHIVTDQLVVEFSKLFKNGDAREHILSDDQVETLAAVIEATIGELLADPSMVVEIVRSEK